MKKLLIIGARGWGREVYEMAENCIGYNSDFVIKGFLDDTPSVLDGLDGYPPIVDSVEHYKPTDDDVFICALGDTHWKRHYSEIILNKGGKFINLIHKNVFIGINTIIGKGCIISKEVGISCDIKIGDFVTFQRLVTLGHDVRVGNYCNFGTMCFMGGGASIGEESTMHTSSIILPHKHVGDKCIIGAGSVVIKNIKNGNTVYGNPCKILKFI